MHNFNVFTNRLYCRFYLADSKVRWDQFPLKVMNKDFGAAAVSLLALTYFPKVCTTFMLMPRSNSQKQYNITHLPLLLPKWMVIW